MSLKRGGRSKEFATHKSELLKKLLKQVPLYKKLNGTKVSNTATQVQRIWTQQGDPVQSHFQVLPTSFHSHHDHHHYHDHQYRHRDHQYHHRDQLQFAEGVV